MAYYKISWGEYEPVTVQADDETVAWAKFCEGNDEARKHPNSLPRKIEEVGVLLDRESAKESTKEESEEEDSPVDQLNANEAIDQIGRMRSHDKLQDIASNDQRATVVSAARRRLTELGPTPASG